MYLLSDYDYDLPEKLIATEPANPRDSAKMLVFRNSKYIIEEVVANLSNYLSKNDILIFNNTKVIPANLIGYKDSFKINFNLSKQISSVGEKLSWEAFAKPSKKLSIGDKIKFAEGFFAKISEKKPSGEIILEFNCSLKQFSSIIRKYGSTPLPPYILKKRLLTEEDTKNYQTIYAKHEGAVASPTAGLHFTSNLLEKLRKKGVRQAFVTLHVGAGTFLPVKCEKIQDHKMHSESFVLPSETVNAIKSAKESGGKVIAVGTTSMRVLEGTIAKHGELKACKGETDIFITPGYEFKITDQLLTNFHLPKSTLLMLISAFSGFQEVRELYKFAIDKDYRFFSYGDCCLLDRK